MTKKRKVEIFSADCPICADAVELVRNIACPSCEVEVHMMSDPANAERATELGIRSLPAVVVNDELASCCTGRGVDEEALRRAGIGKE